MTEKIAHLDGVDIAFDTFGDPVNPAIVLMRGLGTQLIDWHPSFIEGLVDAGTFVVVFDNRDVGLSQKFEGVPDLAAIVGGQQSAPYTLDDMAADIIGLLDHLNIDKAHLIGISMGGMIGQVAAARYPDRFLSFCSVMSSSGRPGLPGPTPAAQAALTAETSPDATQQEIVAATVEGLKVCGSPGYPEPEDVLIEIATKRYSRSHYPAGTARQMAAVIASGDRTELLKSITLPTMVIHGEDDPLIPLAAGEDTAALIPGAQIKAIPGMGHNLPAALSPTLVSIITAFIGL